MQDLKNKVASLKAAVNGIPEEEPVALHQFCDKGGREAGRCFASYEKGRYYCGHDENCLFHKSKCKGGVETVGFIGIIGKSVPINAKTKPELIALVTELDWAVQRLQFQEVADVGAVNGDEEGAAPRLSHFQIGQVVKYATMGKIHTAKVIQVKKRAVDEYVIQKMSEDGNPIDDCVRQVSFEELFLETEGRWEKDKAPARKRARNI